VSSGQSDLIKGPITELKVSVAGTRWAHRAVIIIRAVVIVGEGVVVIGETIVVIGETVVVIISAAPTTASSEGEREAQRE